MAAQKKWTKKVMFKTNDDHFDFVVSLSGQGRVFLLPEEGQDRRGLEIVIDMMRHLHLGQLFGQGSCSIKCFSFEGSDIASRRRFRGEYDFIQQTGWVQERRDN